MALVDRGTRVVDNLMAGNSFFDITLSKSRVTGGGWMLKTIPNLYFQLHWHIAKWVTNNSHKTGSYN